MKRMKKLFAILMTMAMVMGLGITGFAAENNSGDITVTGLVKEDTTIIVYQILKADENVNNWEIVDWVRNVENAVTLDEQDNEYDINWDKLYQSLPSTDELQLNVNYWTATTNTGSHTFEDLPLGAYLVRATSNVTGSGTMYNVMGTYNTDYNTEHLMVGKDATVYAKASTIPVTKEAKEGDNFVAKGEEVEFTVTTTFPSFTDEELAASPAPVFKIKDTPTGLDITGVTAVYIGDVKEENKLSSDEYSANYGDGADAENYYIDLSSQIGDENANAGKTVTVTYKATVTADNGYSNTANIVKNDTTIGTGGDETGHTADITVVKKNESDEVLSGAVFNVYMSAISEEDAAKEDSNTREALYFIGQDGVYSLAEQGETMKVDGDTTLTATTDIVTNSEGKVQIKGLGEGYYFFDEIEAPEGYTINPDGVKFTVSDQDEHGIEWTHNVSLNDSLIDTTMAALPSTGGMGTTLFTIAGCVIMISAAGLFFATRKKAN